MITMYYYISPCNIPFLTSLKPMHGFASNFVWMIFRQTPTKFDKFWVQPLSKIELLVMLGIFCQFLDLKHEFKQVIR